MSSSRLRMRWMSPRSMGGMNDLCKNSRVWCATVSASCSTCLMRLDCSSTLTGFSSNACSNLAPSTLRAACLENMSKNSDFLGSSAPNIRPPGSFRDGVLVEHAAVKRLRREREPLARHVDELVAERLELLGDERDRLDVDLGGT